MKAIPTELMLQFERLLQAIAIPREMHSHYKKWLRYYLDFCRKYNIDENKVQSLPNFLNKRHKQKNSKLKLHILYHYFINWLHQFKKATDGCK